MFGVSKGALVRLGRVVLQQKQHDGCEIQLLEGEDTHTLLLVPLTTFEM